MLGDTEQDLPTGEIPRWAGFSLSVGKHVVKRYPSKNDMPDLCCKSAC